MRPFDINIECGFAGNTGTLLFNRFNESALNTFDAAETMHINKPPYQLIDTAKVAVERLDVLLTRHLPAGKQIDSITVGVEGNDEEVLRSIDWRRYRPRFILAETLRTNMLSLGEYPVVQFLRSEGYTPVSKAYNTSFFAREAD